MSRSSFHLRHKTLSACVTATGRGVVAGALLFGAGHAYGALAQSHNQAHLHQVANAPGLVRAIPLLACVVVGGLVAKMGIRRALRERAGMEPRKVQKLANVLGGR